MPARIAPPSDPAACYPAVPGAGIEQNQIPGPDVFPSRARDARGRFAKGHSGNPRGRPPGIRNPQRRLLDFVNRPPKPGAVETLVRRRPYLLRRFAQQVLPPPAIPVDPAERLGLDLSSVRTLEEARQLVSRLWAAISGGKISPGEGLVIVRRVRRQQRAGLRLQRLARRLARLAHKTGAVSRPLG